MTTVTLSKEGIQLPDNILIQEYLETQDAAYFSAIYDRYANKIYSKCYSLLKDTALAEDATQDIFTKIFLRMSSFNQKSQFSTWVYSITHNYCIDYLRKQRKKWSSDDDEQQQELLDKVVDTDDSIKEKELLELELDKLAQALDKLSPEDKSVLLMKYKDDLSIKDICDVLDKSESAVKMKLKRARERAKDEYDKIIVLFVIFYILESM